MPGHSAKTCRKTNNNQKSTFPSNNFGYPNKPYEHRDKNRNGFYEQIIKMVISSQIIQIIIIKETLIDKV